MIEDQELLESQQLAFRDKLVYTIGSQKGSTTGGVGFIIKHYLVQRQTENIRSTLVTLRTEKDACK